MPALLLAVVVVVVILLNIQNAFRLPIITRVEMIFNSFLLMTSRLPSSSAELLHQIPLHDSITAVKVTLLTFYCFFIRFSSGWYFEILSW